MSAEPSGLPRSTMSRNCSGVCRRPWAVIVALSCWPGTAGVPPSSPTATCCVLRPDRRRSRPPWMQVVGLELARVEPDAHRVLACRTPARCRRPARARADRRCWPRRSRRCRPASMLPSSRDEADDHQEAGARLGDADALLLHGLRQQRRGELQLVLHLHLRDVGIGAAVEGQRDRRRGRRTRWSRTCRGGRRAPSCSAR